MPVRACICTLAAALCLASVTEASAQNSASGAVTVTKLGAIKVAHAVAYRTRDPRNARNVATEILLTDVPVKNPAALLDELDPHMAAINLDELKDRNYILVWVRPDGHVSMNATFSKTMTQYLNDSTELKTTLTTNTDARVDARVYSAAPLKTMDGTTYTVDFKFAVDVPKPAAGTPLPAGGGDPGKAFTTFVGAALKKNWPGVKAGLSAKQLPSFDRSYNTPAENADSAADLIKAWIPTSKMKVTKGELRGADVAILEVEGEKFEGMGWLSIVRMVKEGGAWKFDRSAPGGNVK
jgi:hypothetical protein